MLMNSIENGTSRTKGFKAKSNFCFSSKGQIAELQTWSFPIRTCYKVAIWDFTARPWKNIYIIHMCRGGYRISFRGGQFSGGGYIPLIKAQLGDKHCLYPLLYICIHIHYTFIHKSSKLGFISFITRQVDIHTSKVDGTFSRAISLRTPRKLEGWDCHSRFINRSSCILSKEIFFTSISCSYS